MAATQNPQTDVRLQVDEPRRPPEPPESPDRRIAAIALVAVILVGACIATGFVLATGSGNDGPGQAATAEQLGRGARQPRQPPPRPASPPSPPRQPPRPRPRREGSP